MRLLMLYSLLIVSATCMSEEVGFRCVAQGAPPDNVIWKYFFEIDKGTGKGVQSGLTYGGSPYSKDIDVVFTPERMQIRKLGSSDFTGYIDRSDLSFNFGGAIGSCEIVPVSKRENKF